MSFCLFAWLIVVVGFLCIFCVWFSFCFSWLFSYTRNALVIIEQGSATIRAVLQKIMGKRL